MSHVRASSRGRRLILAAAPLVVIAAVPRPASATPVAGLGKLSGDGPAYRSLTRQGVKVEGGGQAAATKAAGATTFLLPTTSVDFAATTRTTLGGSLVLRRTVAGKRRAVKLTALQVRLSPKGTRAVSAKLAGRRIDVLRLDLRKGEYTVDAKTLAVRIGGTRASLTPAAAKAIGSGLALRTRRSGAFGVLSVATSAPVAGGGTTNPGATVTGPAAPGAAGSGPATTNSGGSPVAVNTSTVACTTTLPATTRNTDGTPYLAPTPLTRPTSAVDVMHGALRWRPRESFVRYVSGGGEGVTASAGAAGGPATGDGRIDVDFTPAVGSWYDRASDTGRLLFTGCLAFSYRGHGINLQVSDPQIELSGASSRLLATITAPTASDFTGLAQLASLELAGGQETGSTATRIVRGGVPVRLTGWANERILGGFYPAPDDAFGQLTVSAELPS